MQEEKILLIFALGQVSTIFFISAAKMEGPHILRKPSASYLSADYQIINIAHQPTSPPALSSCLGVNIWETLPCLQETLCSVINYGDVLSGHQI